MMKQGGWFCRDFKVSDLKVGDTIYKVQVEVEYDYNFNWCLKMSNIVYEDDYSKSAESKEDYKVVEIDLEADLIKLVKLK